MSWASGIKVKFTLPAAFSRCNRSQACPTVNPYWGAWARTRTNPNSVIEHVGDAASQRRFAREIARVGRAFWVQTPNRWFPVEQHLLTPLVHWLPRRWQRAVVRRGTVWSALTHPTPDRREFYLEHFLRDVRLLGFRELRSLFPGARIIRERFLGITKSLIAVRSTGGTDPWHPAAR